MPDEAQPPRADAHTPEAQGNDHAPRPASPGAGTGDAWGGAGRRALRRHRGRGPPGRPRQTGGAGHAERVWYAGGLGRPAVSVAVASWAGLQRPTAIPGPGPDPWAPPVDDAVPTPDGGPGATLAAGGPAPWSAPSVHDQRDGPVHAGHGHHAMGSPGRHDAGERPRQPLRAAGTDCRRYGCAEPLRAPGRDAAVRPGPGGGPAAHRARRPRSGPVRLPRPGRVRTPGRPGRIPRCAAAGLLRLARHGADAEQRHGHGRPGPRHHRGRRLPPLAARDRAGRPRRHLRWARPCQGGSGRATNGGQALAGIICAIVGIALGIGFGLLVICAVSPEG